MVPTRSQQLFYSAKSGVMTGYFFCEPADAISAFRAGARIRARLNILVTLSSLSDRGPLLGAIGREYRLAGEKGWLPRIDIAAKHVARRATIAGLRSTRQGVPA